MGYRVFLQSVRILSPVAAIFGLEQADLLERELPAASGFLARLGRGPQFIRLFFQLRDLALKPLRLSFASFFSATANAAARQAPAACIETRGTRRRSLPWGVASACRWPAIWRGGYGGNA